MASPYVLYTYWRSSCSHRVRIALGYKKLAWEPVFVNLLEAAQTKPEYHAKNPTGYIPALLVDGQILGESIAILEYLEETRPRPPLLPAEPLARARVRQLTEVINAGIQPLQNSGVQRHLSSLGVDSQGWLERFVGPGLAALEAMTRPLAGAFCVGDALSFADVALVPQLYFARRFGISLEEMPTLRRIEATCAAMACFQVAHAERQPDAPRI